MRKLIYGVGYDSGGIYKNCVDGKTSKIYGQWYAMLRRCYCASYQKKVKTYIGCSVVEEWHDFQNYAKWHTENYVEGFHIDKDIIFENNKIYGPETCCVVPQAINSLFLSHSKKRGKWLQGVDFQTRDNKFRAQVTLNGVKTHIGLYETEMDAHLAYKKAKEQNVKNVANQWQDKLDDRVIDSMLRWTL